MAGVHVLKVKEKKKKEKKRQHNVACTKISHYAKIKKTLKYVLSIIRSL